MTTDSGDNGAKTNDDSWRSEGWVPAAGVFLVALLGIAMLGWIAPQLQLASVDRPIGWDGVLEWLRDSSMAALVALADAGAFFSVSASWALESLIAIVVAVVAIPALRDLAPSEPRDNDARVNQLMRRVGTLLSDESALEVRRTLPALRTDIALRKLAGVLGQLIASLSLLILVTYAIAYFTKLATVEPGSEGTLFIAPFITTLAVVAGLYRIDPESIRSRRLMAQILDERALNWRAAPYTPPRSEYPGRKPTSVAWTYRILLLTTLTTACIVGIGVRALQEGATWAELINPWWDLPMAILLLVVLFGFVLTLFHIASLGVVWARFWIGGPLGWIIGSLIGIVFAMITVAFIASVLVPGYARGDWGLTSLLLLAILAASAGEALPLFVKWKKPLQLLPGYASMRQFSDARAEYIERLMERLRPRLEELRDEAPRPPQTFWQRLAGRISSGPTRD